MPAHVQALKEPQKAFVHFLRLFFYSSSRNTRDFNREIRAQSEIRLHREYNFAIKNKTSGGLQIFPSADYDVETISYV